MADDSSQVKNSDEEDELQKHVDAMMSANEDDGTPAVSMNAEQPDKQTKKPKSAPNLPRVYRLKELDNLPIVMKLEDDPTTKPESELSPDPLSRDNLDDKATEEAVDDIATKESDMVLAVEDAKAAHKSHADQSTSWKAKVKRLLKSKWTWIGLACLLVLLFALPQTRYPLLGLFIKEPIKVTVLDSKTGTPVSRALVQVGGDSEKTDGNGHVTLKASLGKRTLTVSNQYYQSLSSSYFVGFKEPSQPTTVRLVATGRLVPITVMNEITGKPLSDVGVAIKGTTAKTNASGQATIALPTTSSSYAATLSLNGYNLANVVVQVTDQVVKANTFQLVPAGRLYFLSNLSGTIDVVKTNLDGSDRKTILAGTGSEDPNSTSLLASRDWRYLVLKSRRSNNQDALYLIDTSADKVTEFDNSGSSFTLVGWYNHNFIYDLSRPNASNWQSGRESLKSYDADNLQLNQLDQNQAEGSVTSYAYQYFANFYIVNGYVVYNTEWNSFTASGVPYNMSGKSDTIRAVQPSGQNVKDYQSFSVSSTNYFIQAVLYSPDSIYYSVNDNTTNKTNFYEYSNQAVSAASINSSTFTQSYPTYLVSPSGNLTFWTELRDGKNTLFTGDDKGGSQKQIASRSDYSPYGWYSDNYVLVAKNASELYIMPAGGSGSTNQPIKITDYYKPAQTYNGYGYGYGGL